MDDEDYEMFKIVVIGDSGTGKTNITTRFVKDEYSDSLKPTVGVEFLAKVIKVNGSSVKITFWDTAGQERYKSLSKVYYKGAAGIIIVYDITQQQTYNNVESWMRLANENLNISEVKMIIIGNKADDEANRQVQFEKAKADYKDRFDVDCFETSAKTGAGIQESIMSLVQSIYTMNSKIKGTQMPFDQDYDDDDTGPDVGSVAEPKAKVQESRPAETAFKKAKQQTKPITERKPTTKDQPTKATEKKPQGQKLSKEYDKKEKKKGGCC